MGNFAWWTLHVNDLSNGGNTRWRFEVWIHWNCKLSAAFLLYFSTFSLTVYSRLDSNPNFKTIEHFLNLPPKHHRVFADFGSQCLISNLESKILFKVSRRKPHRVFATGFKTSIVLSNMFNNCHLDPLKFEIGACFEQRDALLNNELQYLNQIHLASPCIRNWIHLTFKQWVQNLNQIQLTSPCIRSRLKFFFKQ